jgi:hypothetical protein
MLISSLMARCRWTSLAASSRAPIALAKACPATVASPGPRSGLTEVCAAVAIPHSAAATRRMVWISESPDPTSPLRGIGPGKSSAPSTQPGGWPAIG